MKKTMKGTYSSLTEYNVGDVVKYGEDYYLKLAASSAGTEPTDTRYWTLIVDPSLIDTLDVAEDVEGGAASTYVKKADVSNTLTVTAEGKVLDARQGKALKDLIDALDLRVTALEPETTPAGEG